MSEEKVDTTIEKEIGRKETGRIEAFSDGVFAVAITLLVFSLKVPQLPASDSTPVIDLGKALFNQWPSYIMESGCVTKLRSELGIFIQR